MDAATLYVTLMLANGEKTTSTVDFSTLWKCEQKIEWLKLVESRHPTPPGAVTSYRCEEHKITPAFYASVYGWRGRPRDHFGPASRRGCTAYQWVMHMRDRGLKAHCYELPRSSDAPHLQREPNMPDNLDIRGMPGVPKAQ